MNLNVRTTRKDEYLTPPYILDVLGFFDLDPCCPVERPWDTAKKHLTVDDDGLFVPWRGRVWMNPPYGNQTGKWMKRLAEHGNGIALIFARTETKYFFKFVWEQADAILFLKGRLVFFDTKGVEYNNSGPAPSCLIAYGEINAEILENSRLTGKFIDLKEP